MELLTLFFTQLQVLPTQIHRFHLQTKSYSQHIALGELYKESSNLVDKIIESYQGIAGEIIIYDELASLSNLQHIDLLPYLNTVYNTLSKSQELIKYTDVISLIDELKTSVSMAKYKITFLK